MSSDIEGAQHRQSTHRQTPVADLVARQRTGPPAIVLAPGPRCLGLVGVAALLNGDSTGTTTLVTTVETMVAIALGVLVGRAVSIIASARRSKQPAVGHLLVANRSHRWAH